MNFDLRASGESVSNRRVKRVELRLGNLPAPNVRLHLLVPGPGVDKVEVIGQSDAQDSIGEITSKYPDLGANPSVGQVSK